MTTAEIYVTAAYLVFLAFVLLYVVIYSGKMARLEREVAELSRRTLEELADEEAAGTGAHADQKQAVAA
jgi:hypothetical protein